MITLINHQGLKVVKGLQIQTPSPSIGLAYLGAFLKKHGYNYKAIDACGEALDQIYPYAKAGREKVMIQGLTVAQVLERIPSDTRIIGFTCLFSHCWPLVLDLARAVREKFPDALFVAGGEHPTAMPEQVLQNRLFNAVVLGEGEETFLELVQGFEDSKPWKDIHGIVYVNEQGAFVRNAPRERMNDIDSLSYPDWDNWCIEAYINHHQVSGIKMGRLMPILGSRGCPYECTFCSSPEMWTRKYVMRDPVRLVDEMEFMINKYGVSGFTFMDSTFIIDRAKTLKFAFELIRRNLNITYQLPAGTRCEAFDAELATTLDNSGLKNFAFAPESGSIEILEAVKKRINHKKFFDAVRVVLRTKMTVGCFIVIGFPEDTCASLKATLKLIRRLALIGIHDVTVSKFTPYPGSHYFKRLVAEGKIGENMNELNNIIDFFSAEGISYSETISSRRLYWWMIWLFLNFYVTSFMVRPWRLFRNFWLYLTQGVENTRYMRLVTELFFLRRRWAKNRI